jgi:hypothetical protein
MQHLQLKFKLLLSGKWYAKHKEVFGWHFDGIINFSWKLMLYGAFCNISQPVHAYAEYSNPKQATIISSDISFHSSLVTISQPDSQYYLHSPVDVVSQNNSTTSKRL